MIDPNVEKQLADAESGQEVQSLMLQWTDAPEPSLFAGVNSKGGRLQRLEEFYRSRKEIAIRHLQGEENLVVRDLPHSASVILTGPVVKLQEMVQPGSLLERTANIHVLPNVQFHALAGR